ncbi:MAG: chemotaxis protein CheC [Xenococcaceae cyanobacterium MO_207.B15]|nr:chemotaxis protein CheC [Xenococcaceae cyanobacterium MO_207.B15]
MKLTANQLDALTELINIGVGQAAAMLNEMIEFRIQLQVPWLKLLSSSDLQQQLQERLGKDPLSSVQLEFSGSFRGNAQLVFPTDSAATLVEVLTGEESPSPSLDELKIGTLTEVVNIVINGVMGSISNILTQPIHYDVPNYIEEDIEHLLPCENNKSDEKGEFLLAQSRFDIQELKVEGDIILFFHMESFHALLAAINNVES